MTYREDLVMGQVYDSVSRTIVTTVLAARLRVYSLVPHWAAQLYHEADPLRAESKRDL